MPKFRKKPVVIDAEQFTEENKDRACNFVTCNCYPDFNDNGQAELRIQTLEGEMTASLGDWIIKGVSGEFYPCKPDIFEKTYEQAYRTTEKIEDYKVRVIEEKKELDEKIVKLAAFIFSSNSSKIGDEEINILNGQLHCMIDYSMTLRERISRF